jgi:hypothetical protein
MSKPVAAAAINAPVSWVFHCSAASGVGSYALSPRFVRMAWAAATRLTIPVTKKAQPRSRTEASTPATGPIAMPSSCAAKILRDGPTTLGFGEKGGHGRQGRDFNGSRGGTLDDAGQREPRRRNGQQVGHAGKP